MKSKILKLILIALLLTSCISDDEIIGSGNLLEQQLSIPNFNKIKIISTANINLTHSNTQSVLLVANDNIIDDISAEVTNNTLVIKYKYDNINYTNESVTLHISIPTIDHIKVYGSSKFTIYNFNDINNLTVLNTGSMGLNFTDVTISNNLTIKNTGSLKFTAIGNVQDLSITNSGSQKIYCFDLISNNCTISNSGSGKTKIFCNDNLNIINSGSNDVFYKGYPNLTIHSTGSGNVTSAN